MMIPVMLAVTLLIFFLLYITPGDPIMYILGTDASAEAVAEMGEQLGLNDPFFVRYFNYIKDMVTKFSFGISYTTKQDVSVELTARLPNTIKLALLASLVSLVIGVTTGIIAAMKQNTVFDTTATVFALTGVSTPGFFLGLMLIILFALKLKWLPPSGFSTPIEMVLPVVTLGFNSCAGLMRQTRSAMLEVIRQDYITTARAKGQTEFKIVMKHALQNALIPVLTSWGILFGGLLGGAVVIESVFSVPGLGKLMLDAVTQKNYPVVLGGVLVLAVLHVLVNLLTDILYAFVDPRIRAQYARKKRTKKTQKGDAA